MKIGLLLTNLAEVSSTEHGNAAEVVHRQTVKPDKQNHTTSKMHGFSKLYGTKTQDQTVCYSTNDVRISNRFCELQNRWRNSG